jgi:hypothetical protein
MPISSVSVEDYNAAFVDATNVAPIAAAYVNVKLTWTTGGKCYTFDIYPNSLDKFCPYSCDEKDAQGQKLRSLYVHRHNFFQELSVSRVVAAGGATVKLILFDPSGRILEDALLSTFVMQANSNEYAVSLILEYGWCTPQATSGIDGRPIHEPWIVGTTRAYILVGIDVSAEYTGVAYTLSFVDAANSVLNVKPPGWAQNVYLFKQGPNTKELSLPQAVLGYWVAMHSCGMDVQGSGKNKTTVYLIRDADGAVTAKDWFWNTGQWTKKPAEAWTIGTDSWMSWLTNQLSSNLAAADDDSKYTVSVFASGQKIGGDPEQVQYYTSTAEAGDPDPTKLDKGWKTVTSIEKVHAEKAKKCAGAPAGGNSSDTYWEVPQNTAFVYICKDKRAEAAKAAEEGDFAASNPDSKKATESLSAFASKNPPIKRYQYLSPSRDPHATVVGLSISGSNLFALYMARHAPNSISRDEKTQTGDMPKDDTQITPPWDDKGISFSDAQKVISAGKGDSCSILHAGAPLVSSSKTTPEERAANANAMQLTEATAAFVGMKATLEVIGDPDLLLTLQNTIEIDFNPENAGTMLPWVRGDYLVLGVTDRIRGNDWTTSLDLIKVGPIYTGGNQTSNTVTAKDEKALAKECEDGARNSLSESPSSPWVNMSAVGPPSATGASMVGTAFSNSGTGMAGNPTVVVPSPGSMQQAVTEATDNMPSLASPTVSSLSTTDFMNAFGVIGQSTQSLGLFKNGTCTGPAGLTQGMASLSGVVGNSAEAMTDDSKNLAAGVSVLAQMIETPAARTAGNVTDQTKIALASYRFGYDAVNKVVREVISAKSKKQSTDNLDYIIIHGDFDPITFEDIKTPLANAIVEKGEFTSSQVAAAVMNIASFQLASDSRAVGYDLALPPPATGDSGPATTQPTEVLINDVIATAPVIYQQGVTFTPLPVAASTQAAGTDTSVVTSTPPSPEKVYWPPQTDPRVDPPPASSGRFTQPTGISTKNSGG